MSMRVIPPPAPPLRRAFTLVELLVVIAIIAMLMSILMPSLGRARQQARSVVCRSNLRQIMIGATMYSDEHGGSLPAMQYDVVPDPNYPDSTLGRHGWAELIYSFLSGYDDYPLDADFPVQRNHSDKLMSNEYGYFLCKEAQPTENHSGHYRVYQEAWERGSLTRIRSRLPLIMDADPVVTYEEDLRTSYIAPERCAGLAGEATIDERHYGGANYAFHDSHVDRYTNLREKLAVDWDLDASTPNR